MNRCQSIVALVFPLRSPVPLVLPFLPLVLAFLPLAMGFLPNASAQQAQPVESSGRANRAEATEALSPPHNGDPDPDRISAAKVEVPRSNSESLGALRPLANLAEAMEAEAIALPENASVEQSIEFIRELSRLGEQLARDYRIIQAEITRLQGDVAEQLLRNSQALSDDDFYFAAKWGLSAVISEIPSSTPKQQQQIGSLVIRQLRTGLSRGLELDEVRNAVRTADYLDRYAEPSLALELGKQFADLIAAADNPRYESTIASLQEMTHRLSLLGQPLELSGTSLDGRAIKLSDYRGRVVLVHFWESQDFVSLAEIPQLKRYAEEYQDSGFQILGVALDPDRSAAESVVAKEQIPWPSLFAAAGPGAESILEKFGIEQLPAAFLIDQQGQVVSTQARGAELERWLLRLLGPKTYVARDWVIESRWKEAAAELQRLVVRNPDRIDYRVALGTVQLLGDDPLGYAGTCQASWPIVLRQSPEDQALAIPLYCLSSQASVNPNDVYGLARSVRAGSDSPQTRLAIILAAFRLGLDEVCLKERVGDVDPFRMSVAALTQAMASFQVGQREQAEEFLSQGKRMIDLRLNDFRAAESSDLPYQRWVCCAIARRFLQEAESLISARAKNP